MTPLRPLLFAATLLAPACSPPPCPEVPRAAAVLGPAAAASTPAASGPRIAISIRPEPGATAVAVEIRATAEPAELATFSLTHPGGAAALHLEAVRDDAGPMEARPADLPDGRVQVTLPRPTSGEVVVAYTVDAHKRASAMGAMIPSVDPDANRFEAAGEPLLLLPDGLDGRVVHAKLTIDARRYEGGGDRERALLRGASSFGVGSVRELDVRGRELRLGVYFAGLVGSAAFDSLEGRDEAAWLGYTSFDPRPIAADVAAFRTAARDLFKTGEEPPLTLLVVADQRQPGAFAATRRARSVLVRLGVGEAWSGPLRIAVATEVLHAWIGGRLWVGPDDAAHEPEAYWFTEGVARHLARDLLFRFGLLTSKEMLDEVHGLLGVAATSARRAERHAELASHAREPGAVPLLVARGALYATGVHARIRAKAKGARGLEDVLRALLKKARERQGALPTQAFIDAVSVETGVDEGSLFARAIGEGTALDPPSDALGPCFKAAPRAYEAFDLGFDDEATRGAADRQIRGLRAGGPAARAGLRAGDAMVDAVVHRGRSDLPVRITVERGGERKVIEYRPSGAKAKGSGFVRVAAVAEEACTR